MVLKNFKYSELLNKKLVSLGLPQQILMKVIQ